MEVTVLNSIPYRADVPALLNALHIDDPDDALVIERMAAEAEQIARPKALCKLSFVESRTQDEVVIDGVTFRSRVLSVNLAETHRVFAFVATCGMELEEWSYRFDDPLEQWWAGTIMEQALRSAFGALDAHINAQYQPGSTAAMNPGSLEDWPIQEQRQLFSLFGDPGQLIGVTLKPSFLMIPTKSVSGMFFQTESGYTNCKLCPREMCPNRRAPYDPHLREAVYA